MLVLNITVNIISLGMVSGLFFVRAVAEPPLLKQSV